MPKRKPKIIADKKQRGEWAESVFMAKAHEHSLPVSKPWGELSSYDFVIGKTGRFVSVQVKSTMSQMGRGYVCTVRGGHKAYRAGSFDFLAVYVVAADAWYILPFKVFQGKRSLAFYPNSPKARYENYREAWHLLHQAAGTTESPETASSEPPREEKAAPQFSSPALARMQAAGRFMQKYWDT